MVGSNKRTHAEFSEAQDDSFDALSKRLVYELSSATATRIKHEDIALTMLRQNIGALQQCLDLVQHATRVPHTPGREGERLNTTLKDGERDLLRNMCRVIGPAVNYFTGRETEDEAAARRKAQEPPVSLEGLTKWTVSDIPRNLPKMPHILDHALETAALTHRGALTGRPGENEMSYEALEWAGDSYINTLATHFIQLTFGRTAPAEVLEQPKPEHHPASSSTNNVDNAAATSPPARPPAKAQALPLDPGRASHLRQLLVRNATLAGYSREYELDKRAHLPSEFSRGGRAGGTNAGEKERTKVLADMFEAYVGALVLESPQNGLSTAADWLKQLWAGTIQSHIRAGRFIESEWGGGRASVVNHNAVDRGAKVSAAGGSADASGSNGGKGQGNVGENDGVSLYDAKNELRRQIATPDVIIRYETTDYGKVQKHRDLGVPMYTVHVILDGWGEKNKLLGWGSAKSVKEAGMKAALAALANKKLLKPYTDMKLAYQKARDEAKVPRGPSQATEPKAPGDDNE